MSEPSGLRAVLDTNVYVSGTILSCGTPFAVLEAWRRQAYTLITSDAIIAEAEQVLRYTRIHDRYKITDQDIERLVNSLRTDALVVPGDYQVEGVSTDPEDDKFLACALEGRATCIVTGDPDLLNLGRYHGIEILKPHEFLERLGLLP